MKKYFCPYCNFKYYLNSINHKDKLLCRLCGEEMIKKSFFNIKQIISLLILLAFIMPLFFTFLISIINRKHIKKNIYKGYKTELIRSINLSKLKLNPYKYGY